MSLALCGNKVLLPLSMEKSWFNLMFSKGELEHRGDLSKAMDSFSPIEKKIVMN